MSSIIGDLIFEDDDDEIGGVKRRNETRRGSLYEYSSHLFWGSGGTPFCGAIPATTSSCGYVPDTMPSGVRPHGANCGCGCRDASTNGRGFSSSSSAGSENRGVVFMGPNDVQVKDIPFPKLELDSTNSPVVSNGKRGSANTG